MTVTDPATEVAGLDAVAQAELVRRGEATATELVTWAIERIERREPSSQIFASATCSTSRLKS